jgi:hypothetical protein
MKNIEVGDLIRVTIINDEEDYIPGFYFVVKVDVDWQHITCDRDCYDSVALSDNCILWRDIEDKYINVMVV